MNPESRVTGSREPIAAWVAADHVVSGEVNTQHPPVVAGVALL